MCTRKEILDRYPRSVWERLIEEWIYSERDRQILRRKLMDGITFDQLAEEFDQLQIDQLKRRYYAAEERLFEYAENASI